MIHWLVSSITLLNQQVLSRIITLLKNGEKNENKSFDDKKEDGDQI